MSGAHVRDEIDACLDGALSDARRQAVLAHADTCVECGAALERASRLHRALGQAPVPDPGAAYWTEFAARVEARIARPASLHGAVRGPARSYERLIGWLVRPSRFGWVGVAGTVAAATLIVYVGLRGFQPRDMHVGVRATAPALKATPEGRGPSAPVGPEAEAPLAGAPLARVPDRSRKVEKAGRPIDELRTVGKTKTKTVTAAEAPAVRAGGVVAQRPDGAQVVTRDTDSRNDPVADFVRAAVAGDSTTASATYTALAATDFATLAPDDAERLRDWAAASGPPAVGASPKSFPVRKVTEVFGSAPSPVASPLAAPAPSGIATPQTDAMPRAAFDAKRLDAPPSEPLLALEALAWPRRTDPSLRPTLAALADQLARLAPHDARAAGRADRLASWLEDTSTSRQERVRWGTLRQSFPGR